MQTASPTVIAVDGRPASPAMAAALAAIHADGLARAARKAERQARIDADRRIKSRMAAREALKHPIRYGVAGAMQVFRDTDDGTSQRRGGISRLIDARVALIDRDFALARRLIRDAIFCRRQAEHLARRYAMTPAEVVGAVRLLDVVEA